MNVPIILDGNIMSQVRVVLSNMYKSCAFFTPKSHDKFKL